MKLSKFQVILLTFALFGQLFFSGFYVLTGRVYGGAAIDNSYITFMMAVDVIPLFFFLRYLGTGLSNKNVGLIITSLLIYMFILLIESSFDFHYPLVKSFPAYSIPCALIGVLIAKYNVGDYLAKWLEPLMLFLTIVGIRSMSWILLLSFSGTGDVGIGAQSLSYHCGFAFALNLYFLLFGNELNYRFKYAKTLFYKYISMALLVVQVVVSISSGGRGGFVLVAVSSIILIMMRLLERDGSFAKFLITLLLITVTAILAIQVMPDNIQDALEAGSERTFSYISKSGIDMTETSSRDYVYGEAIKDIRKNPILGYGLLMKGSYIEGSWPHNIILEVLLQGGIIYLLVFLFILYHFLLRFRLLVKDARSRFIVPIALYPAVMLCFSGSYITTGLFWFVVSYVFCYDSAVSSSRE